MIGSERVPPRAPAMLVHHGATGSLATSTASCNDRWQPHATSFSSAIVTSTGGVGSSLVLGLLQALGVPTNDPDNEDHLKHHIADGPALTGSMQLPTHLGARPLVVFVFDDPTRSVLSLARKGWLNNQASHLNSTFFSQADRLAGSMRCVKESRHAHSNKVHGDGHSIRAANGPRTTEPRGCPMRDTSPSETSTNSSDTSSDCATPKMCPKVTAERAMMACSINAALQTLAPHAQTDFLGLESHFTGWLHAACAGSAIFNHSSIAAPAILFVRSRTFWAHAHELTALFGIDGACIPNRFCTERRSGSAEEYAISHLASNPSAALMNATSTRTREGATGGAGSKATGSSVGADAVLAELDKTFARLRRMHSLVGDYRLVRSRRDGTERSELCAELLGGHTKIWRGPLPSVATAGGERRAGSAASTSQSSVR